MPTIAHASGRKTMADRRCESSHSMNEVPHAKEDAQEEHHRVNLNGPGLDQPYRLTRPHRDTAEAHDHAVNHCDVKALPNHLRESPDGSDKDSLENLVDVP